MAAEKLGKYKTATQDACIFFLIFAGSFSGTFGRVVLAIGLVLFAAATILTVVSGVSYVWKYRIVLKDSEK
jgi:phosphatidylglycerophosphate synthase